MIRRESLNRESENHDSKRYGALGEMITLNIV